MLNAFRDTLLQQVNDHDETEVRSSQKQTPSSSVLIPPSFIFSSFPLLGCR